jgi:hypothetical protein
MPCTDPRNTGNVSSGTVISLRNRFLLAKVQLDHILNYRDPRHRLKCLATVPRDLSAAYNDIMDRIGKSRPGDQEVAMKILSWLFRAQRTLRMNELLEALAVEPGDRVLERQYMFQSQDVIECCKSLVVHDEATGLVRFAHYTVQEFIAGHIQDKLLQSLDLAKVCLTYLAFEEFNAPCSNQEAVDERVQNYEFSCYAAQYWGIHATGPAEEIVSVQETLICIFASEGSRNSTLQLESYANSNRCSISFTKGQTFLHVMAKVGLATICALALDGSLQG